MPDQSVVIELSPSRLELAVVRRGEVVAVRAYRFDGAERDRDWPGVLDRTAPILVRMVEELGCAGRSAIVLYLGQGSVTTVCSCPSSSPARDARRAAEMALTGLAEFALEDNPFEIGTITQDKPGAPTATGATRQTHTLAVADTEDRAAAIAAWAGAAGLRIVGLTPVDAAIQHDAARLCVQSDSPGEVCAVLWLGEHTSALAVGRAGSLSFVRPIAAGVESLVDAAARPLRTRSPDSAPASLNRNTIRTILHQVGIPATGAVIPGHPDVTGASLVPLLQPVIQRLAVEAKQSVRFGVAEADRPSVRLRVAGPGAAIPQLAAILSAQSGFPLLPAPAMKADQNDSSSACGVIAAYLPSERRVPRILPNAERQNIVTSRVRRALWCGATAAAVLIAFDALQSRAALEAQTQTLRLLEQTSSTEEAGARSRETILRDRKELGAVEQRIRVQLGEVPDWPAVLRAIARATPAAVRVSTLEMSRSSDGASCRVRASVRTDGGQNAAEVIKVYLDGLGTIPLFEGVKLGACQRGLVDGHESQNFDFTIAAVSLPASPDFAHGTTADAAPRSGLEGTP